MARHALLFLHGFMGNASDGVPLIEALRARLRPETAEATLPAYFANFPLAPAQPQEEPLADQQLKEQMEAGLKGQARQILQRMMQQQQIHGVTHWHIMGYSLGGRIAQALAFDVLPCVAESETLQLASLTLLAAHPGMPDTAHELRTQRLEQDQRLAERLSALKTPADWRAFLDQFWYTLPLFGALRTHPEYAGFLHRRTQCRHPNEGQVWAKLLMQTSNANQRDYREDLVRATFPVLYLAGAQDAKYAQVGQDLAQRVKAATKTESAAGFCYHEVPQAAHMLHFEQPESCVNLCAEHLGPLLW